LVVPRLLTRDRTMWWSVAGGVLAVPAVGAWAWATRPELRPAVALGVPILLLVWAAVFWRRTWLDRARGDVVREVLGVWRRRTSLASATVVRVRDNGARQVVLEVRGAGSRAFLPLLADDLGGLRAQPAEVLAALATEVERWAPEHPRAAAQLRAQSEHLRAGGGPADSPFGALVGVRPRPR
jgi:hypothetical protein